MPFKLQVGFALFILAVTMGVAHGQENTPVLKPLGFQAEHPKCTRVQISPDGRWVVSSSVRPTEGNGPKGRFATIRVWEAATGKMLGEPIAGAVPSLAEPLLDGPWISADSKHLMTLRYVGGPGGPLNHVQIWDLPGMKKVGEPLKFEGDRNGFMALSPDGHIVTVAPDFARKFKNGASSKTTAMQLWEIPSGKTTGKVHLVKSFVGGIAFNKNNKQVFLGGGGFGTKNTKSVQVYDLEKETMVGGAWPVGTLRQLIVDPEGKFALTRSFEQFGLDRPMIPDVKMGKSWEVLRRWEIASGQHQGKPIHVREWKAKEAADEDAAALGADGRTVATLKDPQTVQVIDMETGKAVGPPLQHKEAVYRMAFNPDGKHLWTASGSFARSDGCWLWDVATGKRLGQLPDEGKIISIALHPEGKLVAAANDKGIVKTWLLK